MKRFRVFFLVIIILLIAVNAVVTIYQASVTTPPMVTLREIQFALSPIGFSLDSIDSFKKSSHLVDSLRVKCDLLIAGSRIPDSVLTKYAREINLTLAGISNVIESNRARTMKDHEIRVRINYVNNLINEYGETGAANLQPFITYLGLIVRSIFTWPFIFFLLILFLIGDGFSAKKLSDYLHPFKSVELFGASIELGHEVKTKSQDSIKEFRREVQKKFEVAARKHNLMAKIESIYGTEIVAWAAEQELTVPADLRITIHVPDLLFDESLFQLIDYYPSGGGKGRIFSVRYGIIGLTWRLSETQVSGRIPTDAGTLVRDWGMTKDQASSAGNGRKSMMCFYIRDPKDRTGYGLLYMDSKAEMAFGNGADLRTDSLKEKLEEGSERVELIAGLRQIRSDLAKNTTEIRIYEN